MIAPGIVDDEEGIGVHSANLHWDGVPFKLLAQARLHLPTSFSHDVRAAGEAEHRLGAARPFRDVVVMVIGTGIAASIVLDGRAHLAAGFARKIGHSIVDPDGERCACGALGCLETVASAGAIVRCYRQACGGVTGTAVLDLLAESGRLEIDDIITSLGVSAATARRHLDTLAAQQLLTRTRGGAIGQFVAYDLPLRYKREQNAPQKLMIACTASAMVDRGAVVGLCCGTTSTAIAGVLGAMTDIMEASPHPTLTVVTNALNIAAQLAMRPQVKTVVTGGVVHSCSYELVGPYSDAVLQQVRMDIAFIGHSAAD